MGGGGGGDPAAAARQQEAERQARIQAATDEINQIFNNQVKQTGTRYVQMAPGASINGMQISEPKTTGTTMTPEEFAAAQDEYQRGIAAQQAAEAAPMTTQQRWGLRLGRPMDGGESSGAFGRVRNEDGSYDFNIPTIDQMQASRSERKNNPTRINGFNPNEWRQESYDYWVDGPQVDHASGIVKDRATLYDQQRKSVYDLNRMDVDRQAAEAERANRFGLARAGLLGGSANVDSIGDLDRRTNEGLMRAGGIADQASADLFSADERTRANLISLAQSGIDTGTAAQQALKGLEVNAANAAGARAGATVGDLFGSMSQAYLMNQMRQGQQAGMNPNQQQQWLGVSDPRKGYGGSTS